ncbi:MAG TPA: ABC transporter ATP-binding protein [Acidimicrobiia bacterium]|nr:ABC transporter ATP-binding protein [Acidimicrobiia bacterium]
MTPDAVDGLAISGLTVRYGGQVAVNDVSLSAPRGRLTGLIGPNGAGKTSTFNACSGLLRPSAGHVVLDGHDITRLGPAARARRGIGRTFQKMELSPSMTVAENVALGSEARRAGANPLRHWTAGRRQGAAVRAATDEALGACGIADLAGAPVGELSTGQRRLVELARVHAGGFSVLLLDEPSSGLDRRESEQLGAILRSLIEERGLSILLVEHDMALVMSVCDHLYVLDFGRLIFEGGPDETRVSPVVQAAYLGSAEVTEMAGLGPDGG